MEVGFRILDEQYELFSGFLNVATVRAFKHNRIIMTQLVECLQAYSENDFDCG
jgi:hypothetical protein